MNDTSAGLKDSGKAVPSGSFVGTTNSQTPTKKTFGGASNTLSNIGNSSLTNASTTMNGVTCTLGSACTITLKAARGGGLTTQQAANTTVYYPTNGWTSTNNLAETNLKWPEPLTGTYTTLHCHVQTAPGDRKHRYLHLARWWRR